MSRKNFKTAYSLIELSIVILIISILITGALSVSVSSVNNSKIKTSRDRISEVYKAIGNFFLANKRMPCPASLKKVKTVDADYGVEVGGGAGCEGDGVYQSTTSTNLVYGMVPIRALNLPNDMAEDAYESKLVYIVDKEFTNNLEAVPNFGNPTFATAAFTGIITVNEKPSDVVQTATSDAIMALISYGANKAGAFNANSSAQNPRSSDADELENDATTFDDGPTPKTAVFDNVLIASSGNSDVFDDMVFFKRRNDIVEDFKAIAIIPCEDAGADFANVNAYYGSVVYATVPCSDPNADKRLTRKCEAYGTWVSIIGACP